MQFTTVIISALTAFVASAAPAVEARNPEGNAACPTTSTEYCCNSQSSGIAGGILGLTCVASNIFGNGCSFQSICCVNNGSGTQNCSNTDGTTISIPVSIGEIHIL